MHIDILSQPDDAYEADAAFLRGVMAASGDCIKVLDLDGNLIYMTKTGQQIMEVSDFNLIRGCPWPDFWHDQGNVDANAAIATAKAGNVGRFQGAATTMLGKPRYWDVQVTPILGADGKPERLLSVSRDITVNRLAELKLQQTQERLELALNAGRLGYWEYDLASDGFEASAICRQNFGIDTDAPLLHRDLDSLIHPDDRQHRRDAMARTATTGDDLEVQYRIVRPDGSESWVSVHGRLALSAQGQPASIAGISLDITQFKHDEAHRQLINQELGHRMKNQLAVVQGIVNQSLRGAADISSAKQLIGERLEVLAHAHDALIAGQGERASVLSIIQKGIEAFELGKASLTGPDMHIGPKAALSLALMVHELATNAVKYGALSVATGHVDIEWQIGSLAGQPAFVFSWHEHGGPPVVEPDRKGFGTRLLQAGLSGATSTVVLQYKPQGVHYELAAPLASVQSEH